MIFFDSLLIKGEIYPTSINTIETAQTRIRHKVFRDDFPDDVVFMKYDTEGFISCIREWYAACKSQLPIINNQVMLDFDYYCAYFCNFLRTYILVNNFELHKLNNVNPHGFTPNKARDVISQDIPMFILDLIREFVRPMVTKSGLTLYPSPDIFSKELSVYKGKNVFKKDAVLRNGVHLGSHDDYLFTKFNILYFPRLVPALFASLRGHTIVKGLFREGLVSDCFYAVVRTFDKDDAKDEQFEVKTEDYYEKNKSCTVKTSGSSIKKDANLKDERFLSESYLNTDRFIAIGVLRHVKIDIVGELDNNLSNLVQQGLRDFLINWRFSKQRTYLKNSFYFDTECLTKAQDFQTKQFFMNKVLGKFNYSDVESFRFPSIGSKDTLVNIGKGKHAYPTDVKYSKEKRVVGKGSNFPVPDKIGSLKRSSSKKRRNKNKGKKRSKEKKNDEPEAEAR